LGTAKFMFIRTVIGRLSIFEAMRLQGFPDSFVLEGNLSEQVEQISNAVPPPLAKASRVLFDGHWQDKMPNPWLVQREPNEAELVTKIKLSEQNDVLVQTTLQTNEQVIARVTDGIYRQPASAIRELISNAFDADATRVVVKTDAPKFEKISIEDTALSGRLACSPEVLAHLLYNIGGSAKRTETGETLGITSKHNHQRSPKGRQLIGKIGIGLFSVSQLTHSFQIITKIKGDDHRTIATVSLRQFSDSEVAPAHGEKRF